MSQIQVSASTESVAAVSAELRDELILAHEMDQAQAWGRVLKLASSVLYPAIGMLMLYGVWWMGGRWISNHEDLSGFADFAPEPALAALQTMWRSETFWEPISASLYRIGMGMFYASVIGVPVGIAIGTSRVMKQISNMPMQFMRMISPLAWMPIAVMVFDTWEGSIIFLITAASVWPILFSTSHGLSKIDPDWFKVARNLGAKPWHLLRFVVLPATMQDILTGMRLALGVAWVVLVPAEFLGITSGLGYAINDARDCMEYDRLAATVLVIGMIGFLLDLTMRVAIQQFNWVDDSSA